MAAMTDLGKDDVGGGLVRHVGGDRGDAQPGADDSGAQAGSGA